MSYLNPQTIQPKWPHSVNMSSLYWWNEYFDTQYVANTRTHTHIIYVDAQILDPLVQ